jgi:hypothetical protein
MLAHVLVLALMFSPSILSEATSPSQHPTVRVFANCTAMQKVFPGGVARPGAVNKGGSTRYAPKFSRKLYNANQSMDRDRDGIACER